MTAAQRESFPHLPGALVVEVGGGVREAVGSGDPGRASEGALRLLGEMP